MAHIYAYHKQYEKHEKLDWSELFSEDSISEEMFKNIKSICMYSGARCQSLERFVSLEALVVYSFYNADILALLPSLKYLRFVGEYDKQLRFPLNLEFLEIDVPIRYKINPQFKVLLPNTLRFLKTNMQWCMFPNILPESLNTLVNTISNISAYNSKIILRHYRITYYEKRKNFEVDRDVDESIDFMIEFHVYKNKHNTELKHLGLMDFI